jgi:archaemetzincin
VTEIDLYIPVLTFVFGEAQLSDGGAVVSAHRLRQEFYGMPTDPELLHQRLLKEALHELGHTYGLRHCPDYNCVMSASNGVERIDLKRDEFCPACAQLMPSDEPSGKDSPRRGRTALHLLMIVAVLTNVKNDIYEY